MLAGHDQSGGEVIERDGKKYKQFYGMSSATAMQKHRGMYQIVIFSDIFISCLFTTNYLFTFYLGGVAEYRASEGKTVEVPYRGIYSIFNTLIQFFF